MPRRIVLVATLIGLSITGCSSQQAGHPTSPAGSTAAAAADTGKNACGVYLSGSNVRVLLTPPDTDECKALAKQLSTDGTFWTVRTQTVGDGQLTLVCAMTQNNYTAYVEDTGAELYGRQLCSNFLTQGWNEDTTAENQAANAAASASASSAAAAQAASASSAAAAQLARDEDSATQLIASLQEVPDNLSSDLSTMDGHVQQALSDLAKTKADAAKGQGDTCYNVSTVAYDATQNVGYDATQDVGYDATQDVGYVIGQARQDLASLQTLTQQITGEGGAAPSGTGPTMSSASGAIAAAISHANGDIDQANAAATAAYKIAAGLSTGACTGYADSTFQPVQHIS